MAKVLTTTVQRPVADGSDDYSVRIYKDPPAGQGLWCDVVVVDPDVHCDFPIKDVLTQDERQALRAMLAKLRQHAWGLSGVTEA